MAASKDILSDWLDVQHGSEVTDHHIFSRLSSQFEEEYHGDMDSLNVYKHEFDTSFVSKQIIKLFLILVYSEGHHCFC